MAQSSPPNSSQAETPRRHSHPAQMSKKCRLTSWGCSVGSLQGYTIIEGATLLQHRGASAPRTAVTGHNSRIDSGRACQRNWAPTVTKTGGPNLGTPGSPVYLQGLECPGHDSDAERRTDRGEEAGNKVTPSQRASPSGPWTEGRPVSRGTRAHIKDRPS